MRGREPPRVLNLDDDGDTGTNTSTLTDQRLSENRLWRHRLSNLDQLNICGSGDRAAIDDHTVHPRRYRHNCDGSRWRWNLQRWRRRGTDAEHPRRPCSAGRCSSDHLIFDDSGDTTDRSGTIIPGSITGFGMVDAGVIYTGIDEFAMFLGVGKDTLYVDDTIAGPQHDRYGRRKRHRQYQQDRGVTTVSGEQRR